MLTQEHGNAGDALKEGSVAYVCGWIDVGFILAIGRRRGLAGRRINISPPIIARRMPVRIAPFTLTLLLTVSLLTISH